MTSYALPGTEECLSWWLAAARAAWNEGLMAYKDYLCSQVVPDAGGEGGRMEAWLRDPAVLVSVRGDDGAWSNVAEALGWHVVLTTKTDPTTPVHLLAYVSCAVVILYLHLRDTGGFGDLDFVAAAMICAMTSAIALSNASLRAAVTQALRSWPPNGFAHAASDALPGLLAATDEIATNMLVSPNTRVALLEDLRRRLEDVCHPLDDAKARLTKLLSP